MSNLKSKLMQIEEIEKHVTDHIESIKSLRNDIEQADVEVELKQDEYKKLILNSENEKADKLFDAIQKIKSQIDVKRNRLEVLISSEREVIINDWKKIQSISNTLDEDYRKEYETKTINYIEAKVNAERLKKDLDSIGIEYGVYKNNLAIKQDRMFYDIGVRNIPMGFTKGTPFHDEYLKLKEVQYKQDK